ncbi:hypothetical protein RRG08_025118 [Elysia crispata]|uniref:Uncharacterized protein n=1 Tax=Elysia crispata TaxID=231223 RepID=A0AAE1AIR0_9GAST|nr:hypothetical protein RRG08_025118 [Elysia crispata]
MKAWSDQFGLSRSLEEVTELQMSWACHSTQLPGSLATWQKDAVSPLVRFTSRCGHSSPAQQMVAEGTSGSRPRRALLPDGVCIVLEAMPPEETKHLQMSLDYG